MRLLLTAKVRLLFIIVGGAIDRALCAVNDELQSRTVLEHCGKAMQSALWQLFLVAEGNVKDRTQTMNPLVSLGLSHAE